MKHDAFDLKMLARQAMIERGLEPDYQNAALAELALITTPAEPKGEFHDYRSLLWVSIDNDDSRDLDQLTYAQEEADGNISLWVAIADVDALVKKGSAIDQHAEANTTTVYTPSMNFPMLPEKLSTNLTSLNDSQERVAIVVKMVINQAGDILDSSIQTALVHNKAQTTYRAVGGWLEETGPIPEKVARITGLQQNLQLQNRAAQILKRKRHLLGALSLETPEATVLFNDEKVVGMQPVEVNLAHELIEQFMIGANSVIARFLRRAAIPSFRRVVRVPKRWDRIVEVALELGDVLPEMPDSKALDAFLIRRRQIDPESFADLSLTIVKLLGSGEYVVERPGEEPVGHFGLALQEYTHSTAPNRRYPDVIIQRQVKSLLYHTKSPYEKAELDWLAKHCTMQEDAARKVERQLKKSAAALLLSSRLGESFQGIITGASSKGTWVRLFSPSVEGKVVKRMEHLDVGRRVKVKLLSVDVARGFIDFARI